MLESLQKFAHDYTAIVGGSIGGLCTLLAAYLITRRISLSMKRADFFLQFNSRYHELMDEKAKAVEQRDEKKADRFYHQFFDLMVDQFVSYQLNYIHHRFFVGWMIWRHHQYHDPDFKVFGMTYKEGWKRWCDEAPRSDGEFSQFLARIHDCADFEAVEREVWWWGGKLRPAVSGRTACRVCGPLLRCIAWLTARNEVMLGMLIASALWLLVLAWFKAG